MSDTYTDLAQSQIKAAEAAALRKAAGVVDCSCEWRNLVLGLKSENGRSRWDACGEANCDAITAQSILALISDDQSSALDAYVKAKVDRALERAAEYADRRAADCLQASNMARPDEHTVKFGCKARAKEALNIANFIRAIKE